MERRGPSPMGCHQTFAQSLACWPLWKSQSATRVLAPLAYSLGLFAWSSLPSPQMDGGTGWSTHCTPLLPPHWPDQNNGAQLWAAHNFLTLLRFHVLHQGKKSPQTVERELHCEERDHQGDAQQSTCPLTSPGHHGLVLAAESL